MAKKCYIAVESGSVDDEQREELLATLAQSFGLELTDDPLAADVVFTSTPNLAREPFDRGKDVFVFQVELRGKIIDRDENGPIKPRAVVQFSNGSGFYFPTANPSVGKNGATAAPAALKTTT